MEVTLSLNLQAEQFLEQGRKAIEVAASPVYPAAIAALAEFVKIASDAGRQIFANRGFLNRPQRAVALHAAGKRPNAGCKVKHIHNFFELLARISIS